MYRILLATAVVLSVAQTTSAQAPVFTHPIQSINVCAGAGLTEFTADYTPYPATVVWQVSSDNGSTWQDVSPSSIYTSVGTRYLYIADPPASMDRYQYRAIASNSSGTATSNPAILYVNTGLPNTPVFVNPPTGVCFGNTQRYYITGGLEGDTIAWSIDGWSIYNDITFNDTSKLLNIASNAATSTVYVYVYNGCPGRSETTLQVNVNPLPNTLPATGGGTTCVNMDAEQSYSNTFSDGTCTPVCSILSIGHTPVTGPVQSCVTVDPSVQSYNGVPYVPRHYNIEPQNNAGAATATITLYFTQNDFDAYNAVRGSNPALPTGPSDAAGIANLRITQFHGTGTTPGTYTGATEVFNPNDHVDFDNVVWNNGGFVDGGQRWEVTFDVTGFSGFFVSTGSLIPLPLTLTAFTGQTTSNGNLLQWTTGQEQNTAYFDLQRSAPGAGSFYSLAKVAAAGNSNLPLHYQYLDDADGPASYRLRMVDLDGTATYSKIITLGDPGNTYAYSIKASPSTYIVTAPASGSAILLITDISGRRLYQQRVTLTKGINTFPVGTLPAGSYLLTLRTDKQRCTTKFVRY